MSAEGEGTSWSLSPLSPVRQMPVYAWKGL